MYNRYIRNDNGVYDRVPQQETAPPSRPTPPPRPDAPPEPGPPGPEQRPPVPPPAPAVIVADLGNPGRPAGVPYKIVNNVTCLSWVYILTAIVSLITAIFITILLVRKLKANENYINVMPNNSCSLSENTHNSYSNDEYYTGYNQQDDVDSQANNNQNDIHRF